MTIIYIYETAYSKSKGLIKIGQTDRDPILRMWEQLTGYPCHDEEHPFTLLYQCEAIRNDGKTFTDNNVHFVLEKNNIERLPNTEWFRCSLEEALKAIDEVKNNKYNGNHNVVALEELLETYKDGLSRSDIADLLQVSPVQAGNILTQAERNGLKLVKHKEKGGPKNCVVFYYQLAKYSSIKNKAVVHSFFDNRSNRFFKANNIDFKEILTLINGCGYETAITRVNEKLPQYGRNAIEQLILRIKEPLLHRGYITIKNKRYYCNLNPGIRRG